MHEDDDTDDGPAIPAWARLVADTPEEAPPWMPARGDLIAGKLRVEERIGEGALGAVYRAHDTSPLDRPVAVKLMRVAGENDTFEREARATARVRHPNVVTIFDFGRENGTPYLVLELLHGQTLGERAKAEEIPLGEALSIGADIAAAVAAAHAQQVTHRDLSPHNVFLTSDGQIKVLDFGFAALERALRTQRSARAGVRDKAHPPAGGTPGFMDPRQCDGTDEARVSDLFGLGALLFWLVARRPPYHGGDLTTYIANTKAGPAPRLRDIAPAAPRDLDDLVAALLDADTTARPSAEEARDRLRALRDEVDTRPSGGKRSRRKRATPLVEDPFRPLQTFAAGDNELFFGRDHEIDDLATLVQNHRIVVLHGPSGTGKSSLIQAGLRHALQHEMVWLDVPPAVDPASEPLVLLQERARAALGDAGEAPNGAEPEALLAAIHARWKRPVLVVLDQFEELFQRRSKQDIEAACHALARALRRATGNAAPIHVLFSVRADYLGHLSYLQTELRGILENNLLLEPLGEDATRLAIEMPFELAGFEIPRPLVERIRRDLTDQGQVSPVELQLVCQALFERAVSSGERAIDEDAYKKLGGAGQVLARHLTRAEQGWSSDTASAVWLILNRLVSKGGTRTPPKDAGALVEETGLAETAIQNALAHMVKARIVQPQERAREDEPERFRIAHDRMGQAVWERLSEEHQRGIAARELLATEMGREPKDWLRRALWFWKTMPEDTRAELLRWHAEGAEGASETERAFLRRLAAWERRRRRSPWVGAAAGVLLVVALVGFLLVQREQLREEQARTAEANAERELERDPGKALAWIAEAARLRGGFENEEERYYHQHWLWAQEAWRAGVGWVVADHGGKEVMWVGFSPPEAEYTKATGKRCPDCWPNKKRLFSAGKDGAVRVLDLATRQLQELPERVHAGINDGKISPNGEWIAAGSPDGRAYIWDLVTGERVVLTDGERTGSILELTVSTEGGWLAAGRAEGGIDIWQVISPPPRSGKRSTFQHHRTLHGHKQDIMGLAFSPADNRLLSVDFGGQVRSTVLTDEQDEWLGEPSDGGYGHAVGYSQDGMWFGAAVGGQALIFDPTDKSLVPRRLEPHDNSVTGLGFFEWDGQEGIILGTAEGSVLHYQWNHNRHVWQRVRKLHRHDGIVTRIVVLGNRVLTAGWDGRVFFGEVNTRTQRLFRGHEGRVRTLAESPDGQLVASAGVDSVVRLWSAREGLGSALGGQGSVITSLHSTLPDTLVVAGSQSGQRIIWRDGKPTPVKALNGSVYSICAWPDGRIASAASDGMVEVRSLDESLLIQRSNFFSSSLLCLSDGRLVSGGKNEIRVWSPGPNTMETIGFHADFVTSLALTPDGALVSGSHDGTVSLWDLAQRRRLASFAPGGQVTSAAPLGANEVIAALVDGRLVRWDRRTGALSSIEPRHAGIAFATASHPAARIVVSGGEDGLFLRWVDSGVRRELRGHTGAVKNAVLSHDGRSVISGSGDGTVRIWRLPPTDRAAFRDWIHARAPYVIENDEPKPTPLRDLPPLDGGAQ